MVAKNLGMWALAGGGALLGVFILQNMRGNLFTLEGITIDIRGGGGLNRIFVYGTVKGEQMGTLKLSVAQFRGNVATPIDSDTQNMAVDARAAPFFVELRSKIFSTAPGDALGVTLELLAQDGRRVDIKTATFPISGATILLSAAGLPTFS